MFRARRAGKQPSWGERSPDAWYSARAEMFRAHKAKFLCCFLLFTSPLVSPAAPRAEYQPKWYGYRVLQTYPHDPNAFTQGLIYLDGRLYESTGLRGRSSLRMVDLRTGTVLRQLNLPTQFFGEGLANWRSTLIQLTWTADIGFVHDRPTFHLLRTFRYEGEGWEIRLVPGKHPAGK